MACLGEKVIAMQSFVCFISYENDTEKRNSDVVQEERTQTSVFQVLSYNSVYSFLPERYPHKPHVKEDYPRNVTTLVNTTVKFECPTYSDLEPQIQWIKMSHMFEEGTDPMDDNYTIPIQVRGWGSRGSLT
jgi:hypothetical protein